MSSSSSTIAKDAALLESIDTSSTMDLHRSNLMRMQVNELLDECQFDLQTRKWASDANEYLQLLAKVISKVSFKKTNYQNQADKPVSVQIDKEHALSLEPIGFTKVPLAWTKKSGNAQVLPTFTLSVTVPSDVFSTKDYLNHRYFDKRTLILEKIGKHLASNSKKVGSVEYVWTKGAERPPTLRLIPPSKKKSPRFQVNLCFGIQSIDWIPKLRLVPNRCNIKAETVSIKSQQYNHSLVFDARHIFEDVHLQSLVDHPNISATLVLIQVWALQRGLWRNHDGWTKENVALFLVYLLRTHKMNARMTPVQLFTVVLQNWASTNWLGEEEEEKRTVRAAHNQTSQFYQSGNRRRSVLVLPLEGRSEKETTQQSELGRLYEKQTKDSPLSEDDPQTLIDAYALAGSYFLGPVFLDPSLSYNYLGDVSPNYMTLLQTHAKRSLQSLKQLGTAFSFLFMSPFRFWSQWDIYVQIPVDQSKEWETATRNLIQRLQLALGNRIRGLRVLSTGNGDTATKQDTCDEYPTQVLDEKSKAGRPLSQSPTGTNKIVIGISVNPETSQRVVDRGPPSEKPKEVKSFIELWGAKAQLRRFKDGAIVQAVIWNDTKDETFQNESKLKGGFVEKIVRHIVQLHFTNESIQFSSPSLLSVVDGIVSENNTSDPFSDPLQSHQNVLAAFNSLSEFLRTNSQPSTPGSVGTSNLGLPLPIDAIEPLSPCLRYSELFPPVPHPFLGGPAATTKKVSGALVSEPILIQIRFGSSSKWPGDLKAIGAAKTAMLIQLANAIESSGHKGFDGQVLVTPTHADLGYKGYCFRVLIRADPEIRMLQSLIKPSPVASALLKELIKKHIISSKHHSTIHAVHTLHPSAGSVVRMAKRWLASHLLSGLIETELIELLVAKVYSDNESLLETPGTVQGGFLRFLHLLANHNWAREPLIVDPRGHIDGDGYDTIHKQFERSRGEHMDGGPPMYIIAPYDKAELSEDVSTPNEAKTTSDTTWNPTFDSPEWVVVTRAVSLAKHSFDFLNKCNQDFDESNWSAIFNESTDGFRSYSVLFRVSPDFVVDPTSSSTCSNLGIAPNSEGIPESAYTRSMKARYLGPKLLRRRVYRNLQENGRDAVLSTWTPVTEVMESLRERFKEHALFFFNELSPEVIGLLWRPDTFSAMPFSVMTSDYARPIDGGNWKNGSLVMRNESDLLREMSQYHQDIVTTVKMFEDRSERISHSSKRRKISHGQG